MLGLLEESGVELNMQMQVYYTWENEVNIMKGKMVVTQTPWQIMMRAPPIDARMVGAGQSVGAATDVAVREAGVESSVIKVCPR